MSRPITVSGKGRNCLPHVYDLAYEVGVALGQFAPRDLHVITGGLSGVMDAVAKGFGENGGMTVGLVPKLELRNEGDVSRYNTLTVDTGLQPQLRNWVFANAGEAMISLPGSHGSWQEVCFALDLDRPVWGVGRHDVLFPGVRYTESVEELMLQVKAWLYG